MPRRRSRRRKPRSLFKWYLGTVRAIRNTGLPPCPLWRPTDKEEFVYQPASYLSLLSRHSDVSEFIDNQILNSALRRTKLKSLTRLHHSSNDYVKCDDLFRPGSMPVLPPPTHRHLKPRSMPIMPPPLPPRGCFPRLPDSSSMKLLSAPSSSSGVSSGMDDRMDSSTDSTPPPLPKSPPPNTVPSPEIVSIEECPQNPFSANYWLHLPEEGQRLMRVLSRAIQVRNNSANHLDSECKIVSGSLTKDLRQYLSTRFPKGGLDHELQNTIRDNVYLRTVPVTTRAPRQGEVNGIDYTFLSHDEFKALQRSGSLLEAGVFEGNHYGTPKPSSHAGDTTRGPGVLPGAHPSSEGKRRRNRSNVEAMAANSFSESNEMVVNPHLQYMEANEAKQHAEDLLPIPVEDLGPLPPNWEKAFTESGEPYFIDHVAGTSSWLDPRLARVQKRSAEDCAEDELPFGWERIDDPQYGTYYIDHVNRKTQYENPVVMAKRQGDEPPPLPGEHIPTAMNPVMEESHNGYYTSEQKPDYSHEIKNSMENGHTYQPQRKSYSRTGSFFTRNPAELKGEFLQTTLIKSSRGLGFTIVGGDDNEEEFLQIKSVVPNGPAWKDGKLCTGDVLVYVHDTCVLGYTHADVVNMFQNIAPNCAVYLEVCRGYPLTFDHNDPNTEIVTTVAVTSSGDGRPRVMFEDYDGRQSRNNSSESMNTAKSMPDLSNTERVSQVPRPGSADLLSTENYEKPDGAEVYPATLPKPEYLTIPIVKGGMGFGFTIADSAHGQKVKKILDRSRCKNLSEGDILVDINNINVKGMSHTEVVQVLKDCSQGLEAIVMVQRGGLSSPTVVQQVTRKDQLSPKKMPPSAGLYRSKTPTADMYSSQPKEVMPSRPKTPLVDTRSRSKTPNSYLESQNNHPIDPRIDPSAELQNRYPPDAPSYGRDYPYSNDNSNEFAHYDNKANNVANQLNHVSLNGNRYDTSFDKYANYPVENSIGGYNYSQREPYNRNVYPANCFQYERDNRHNNNAYKQYNGNLVNNSLPESTNYNDQEPYCGYGYHPYAKDNNDTPRQDSGYSSQTQIPPSKNPYPPYYGQNSSVGYVAPGRGNSYDQSDQLNRKREYTSFEMEHPSSGSGAVLPFPSPGNQYQNSPPLYNFSVHLRRKESGFGFRIVGGTEEGSQVSIGHIVPGGAADQDGSVMNGDEIIGVDGENVVGSSHHRVVQLMSAAAANGQVSLVLKRHSIKQSDIHNHSMEIQYPYDVMVTRRENEGFGFVIISSVAKSGSTIGRIIEGSPAERCGKLHIGDRILRVNGVDIKSLHHGNIVNLIKDSGYQVRLTIGPPRDDTSSTASNSHRDGSDAGEEGELYRVFLERGNRGFGFSIRGGREFHNMPLFVLRIADNGPAAEDAKLKVGDQLVEVNGVSTRDMTHAEAIELIKQCGNSISLLVRRGGKITQQFDFLTPSSLGSPVGPPPPGTHIRSTATLPSGSPSQAMSSAFQPSTSTLQSHYPYSGAFNFQNHNGGLRPSAQSTSYVPQLINEQMNGPLGQSSPRVLPPMDVNWNRP